MTDRITLPGTLPGLLRECSPVLMDPRAWDEREAAGPCGRIVVGFTDGGRPILNEPHAPDDSCHIDWLALRIEHETGFLHALWWLRDHGGELAGLASCFSDMHHPPDWRHINQRIGHRFDGLFPDYAIWASAPLALQAVCLAAGGGR